MASLHAFHRQHTMLAGGCGSGGIERLAPHDLSSHLRPSVKRDKEQVSRSRMRKHPSILACPPQNELNSC